MLNNELVTLKGCLPPFETSDVGQDLSKPPFAVYFKQYDFDSVSDGAEVYQVGSISLEGYTVATHLWRTVNAKGTVLVVHGLFDHIGLYLPLVKNLLQQGFDVLAIDLPEHGLSTGVYGEVGNFSIYANALKGLLNTLQHELTQPLFAVGQSTGGAALMAYLSDDEASISFKKVVLLAPLIRPRGWWQILWTYRLLRPFISKVKRTFTINSNDAEFCRFLRESDPLQPRYISVNWVGAMLSWAKAFPALPQESLPVLVVQGTADETVDYIANLALLRAHFPDLTCEMVEGAMHHLVREAPPWRDQVFSALNRFLNDD